MAKMFLLFGFLLVLVIASDNAPNQVEDFMNGFLMGISQPISHSYDWKEYGIYAGQLMKTSISDLISLFREKIQKDDALEIIEGFQASFSSVWGCISTFLDIGIVAFDIFHFTTPGFQTENSVQKTSDILNFSCSVQRTIFDFIFILNTCGGKTNLSLENVMSNYNIYQDKVSSLISDVSNCEANYRQCGKSVGDLIQLLTQ